MSKVQKYFPFESNNVEGINSLLDRGWVVVDRHNLKSKEKDAIGLLVLLEKENDNSDATETIRRLTAGIMMSYMDKKENTLKLKEVIIDTLKENNVCTEQIENIVNSLEIDDFVVGINEGNGDQT
jgi:leucyl-tRNA synthetase